MSAESQSPPSVASRRTVLAAGGMAAVAATIGASARPASARVRLTREQRRVVIIGSGFGGAVTALRLTQAGVPVTLLEQGRRWPSGPNSDTFPTVKTIDQRALFYGSAPRLFGRPVSLAPYAGLFNTLLGPTMSIMSGVGYGGGSLTYQGMSLQPSRAVFEHEFPAALDYDEMVGHYATVARMLRLQTAPDGIIDSPNYATSQEFKRRAEAAGFDVERIPMPVDWSFALRELRGEMKPSYTNGDCAFGVNNGGKQSLDVTYLKAAEATGLLEVRLLHRVDAVSRTSTGAWQVELTRTDERGTPLEQQVITTPTLVMGAGSGGTSRMLVRAKATGRIPDLPDATGHGFGTNADRIYVWTSLLGSFPTPQGGPVIFGSKAWSDPATANTVIQASLPPIGIAGLDLDLRSTMMVAYGVSRERGRFVYNALTDDATLSWRYEGDRELQTRTIAPRVAAIAGLDTLLVDTNALVPSTWHPMGGMNMGDACDHEGRVKGQKGLYVLDGALLPGSAAACNPSMTIAAVAERAMSRIVRDDIGSII